MVSFSVGNFGELKTSGGFLIIIVTQNKQETGHSTLLLCNGMNGDQNEILQILEVPLQQRIRNRIMQILKDHYVNKKT
jgi:hypothetical protein